MKRIKKIACIILVFSMMIALAVPSLGATKKEIKAVSITVSGKIYAGDEVGEEGITVTANGTGYTLGSWESSNGNRAWEGGELPEIVIYLKAKDGYYFNIQKASQITLTGCTYKTAARQDSATTLAVQVVLPKVGLSVGEVEMVDFNEKGVCTWTPVENAGKYEIRIIRDASILGGTKTVTGEPTKMTGYEGSELDALYYDGKHLMTKGGTYHCRVRAVHKDDSTVKGEWTDSVEVWLDDATAKKYVDEYEAAQSAGDWITDAAGTKFRLPDGTFLTGTWRKINKEWYYFKPDGYMAKGWCQVGGDWYYLDPETGKMWCNTTTPDGYKLAIDGRRYE